MVDTAIHEINSFLLTNVVNRAIVSESYETERGRVHENWNGAAAALELSEGTLTVALYTAGGCEPDPYVAISWGGVTRWDVGGFGEIGPFFAGSLGVDAPAWPDFHEANDTTTLPSLPRVLRGVWFNNSVCVLDFGPLIVRMSAGMADYVTPAEPMIKFFVQRG